MAETAQANRVRHFELCFVEFAHSVEKLEPCKSDSFFFAAYGILLESPDVFALFAFRDFNLPTDLYRV